MVISALVVSFLLAPPVDRDRQRTRIAEISRLASVKEPRSIQALITLTQPGHPKWERILALKLLNEHHRNDALKSVREAFKDSDLDIRTEAAIRLHQWRPDRATLQALQMLRKRGANLRRAFQTGERRGRPLYRADAAAFFRESMSHDNVYTKLDGALGLVEMAVEPDRGRALETFAAILKSTNVSERRAAVHYMFTSFSEPGFLPLIREASEDPDDGVKGLALQLLERR